jgi:hypothetical protein
MVPFQEFYSIDESQLDDTLRQRVAEIDAAIDRGELDPKCEF